MNLRRLLTIITLTVASIMSTSAISFNLDSIAEWGKFPRFCVNTYRWGDKFFNSYDSTYVVGTGYKFNVKGLTDSWLDYYHFSLPNDTRVDMNSDPSTSVGLYLTYLAVSLGYDINVSNLFRGTQDARSRYRFGFDCSLLSFEFYFQNNKVGTKIRRFGDLKKLDLPFNDISIKSWGIDLYYFFNNKRYSQAAAFNFSKVQTRSQGSFYAGLAIYSQDYDFDFSSLPSTMKQHLPEWWDNYHYRVKTVNYGLRCGYGYNWVFARNWILTGSVSTITGVRKGFVNSETETTDFSLMVRGRGSVVYNKGRWFAGVVGKIDTSVVNDRQTTFMGHNLSMTAAVGYRFNLW